MRQNNGALLKEVATFWSCPLTEISLHYIPSEVGKFSLVSLFSDSLLEKSVEKASWLHLFQGPR